MGDLTEDPVVAKMSREDAAELRGDNGPNARRSVTKMTARQESQDEFNANQAKLLDREKKVRALGAKEDAWATRVERKVRQSARKNNRASGKR